LCLEQSAILRGAHEYSFTISSATNAYSLDSVAIFRGFSYLPSDAAFPQRARMDYDF
jgi:hypothetical protein